MPVEGALVAGVEKFFEYPVAVDAGLGGAQAADEVVEGAAQLLAGGLGEFGRIKYMAQDGFAVPAGLQKQIGAAFDERRGRYIGYECLD